MSKPAISRLTCWALLTGGLSLTASPSLADELRDALIMAYNSNPTLEAARAQQRGVDESVPIAKSAGLPSLNGTTSFTEFLKKSPNSFTAPDRAFTAQASLGVPLYSGGAVRNSVLAAKTRVVAGQNDLRSTESSVFADVVRVYMDVILAEKVVSLNRANVQRLDVNLQATKDRFEIGDLTRTDVAQSESRLALARGQVRSAEASLIASRERYIQIIGKAPGHLEAPPPLDGLPADADEATAFALDHNPDLLASRDRARAAGYDVRVAGAGRLPRVSLFSAADYSDFMGTLGGAALSSTLAQKSTTAQVGVRASIPLFQGGLPAAQRRQAQARESASLENQISIERQVIAGVRSAYAQWTAANDVISSSQTAVDAAALGLEGVKAENSVGNRTIIDILNAENELLNAQVQLETAKRNAYVAGFNLLSAMGKAGARDLGLGGGVLYDPVANYDRVSGNIWDWGSDPAPKADSTRTVDTKAQDGSVSEQ